MPWRRERLLTPVFWPGEFHGLANSMEWRIPRGRKELDRTERLSLSNSSDSSSGNASESQNIRTARQLRGQKHQTVLLQRCQNSKLGNATNFLSNCYCLDSNASCLRMAEGRPASHVLRSSLSIHDRCIFHGEPASVMLWA